jgi:hypothetical protein
LVQGGRQPGLIGIKKKVVLFHFVLLLLFAIIFSLLKTMTSMDMVDAYYYPNRTSLSSSGLRACLYEAECPGYTICLNNECVMPYLPGHACKMAPSAGPFLGLKLENIGGSEEGGCIGLTCDPYSQTCQVEERTHDGSSYAAIACTVDSECPFQHTCNLISGTCAALPTLGAACTEDCARPYICYQGLCRPPCFTEFDCYIGTPKVVDPAAAANAPVWICLTAYGACMPGGPEDRRPSEDELSLFFGKPPIRYKTAAPPSLPASSAQTPQAPSQPSQPTPNASQDTVPPQATQPEPLPSSEAPAPPDVDPALPFKDSPPNTDSPAAEDVTAKPFSVDKQTMIIAGAAGGALLLLILSAVLIWRIIKKRRHDGISTSTYTKRSKFPAEAPAYVPTLPATTSSTRDYKDPSFNMKSGNASFEEPPPLYKH